MAGIFAGIAMGLNALLTAILVPFALALLDAGNAADHPRLQHQIAPQGDAQFS